jgi:peroxiredoxin
MKNDLKMTLLVDEDRSVVKAFDVFHFIGIDAFRIARPSVFFINEEGKVAFAYVGQNQKDRLSIKEISNMISQETGKKR